MGGKGGGGGGDQQYAYMMQQQQAAAAKAKSEADAAALRKTEAEKRAADDAAYAERLAAAEKVRVNSLGATICCIGCAYLIGFLYPVLLADHLPGNGINKIISPA